MREREYREIEQATLSVVTSLQSVLGREDVGATIHHHEVHDFHRLPILAHPAGVRGQKEGEGGGGTDLWA